MSVAVALVRLSLSITRMCVSEQLAEKGSRRQPTPEAVSVTPPPLGALRMARILQGKSRAEKSARDPKNTSAPDAPHWGRCGEEEDISRRDTHRCGFPLLRPPWGPRSCERPQPQCAQAGQMSLVGAARVDIAGHARRIMALRGLAHTEPRCCRRTCVRPIRPAMHERLARGTGSDVKYVHVYAIYRCIRVCMHCVSDAPE